MSTSYINPWGSVSDDYSVAGTNDAGQLIQILPTANVGWVLTSNGDAAAPTFQVLPSSTTLPFTPVLAFGGASTGITYTTQTGAYRVVDGIVTFTLSIVLTSKGSSSTGAATITGLPVAAGYDQALSFLAGHLTTGDPVAGYISGSTIYLMNGNPFSTLASIKNTGFNNDSTLLISGSYIV